MSTNQKIGLDSLTTKAVTIAAMCCSLIGLIGLPGCDTQVGDKSLAASNDQQPTSKLHSTTENSNWIQLFNGKDLNDWTPKFTTQKPGVNFRDTFRVEDGLLTVSYENWDEFKGEFGHLFYKTPFTNYRLRAEYRFVGEQVKGGPGWALRNNGVMIHGQTPESMELDQDFPNSIEVQLVGGNGTDQRGVLNACTPGTQIVFNGEVHKPHIIKSTGPTFHGDQWVTVEIEVHGSENIKHIVDGNVVLEYSQPQLDDGTILNGGTISIQAETHPIQFRKIELIRLQQQKLNPSDD